MFSCYTWFNLSLLSACALSVSGVTDWLTVWLTDWLYYYSIYVRSENFSHANDQCTGHLEDWQEDKSVIVSLLTGVCCEYVNCLGSNPVSGVFSDVNKLDPVIIMVQNFYRALLRWKWFYLNCSCFVEKTYKTCHIFHVTIVCILFWEP